MTQEELIATLQRLHQAGLPLNITGAKRHYPQLVEVAFSQTPFLGWRLALKKAGIHLDETRWEILETSRCEVCGEAVKHLPNHLRLKHEIRWKDYLEEHPESEGIPESVRAKKQEKLRTKLPHWDPVPSPEYALDRLRGWYDAGYDVNYQSIEDLDGALINQLRRFWHGLSHDDLLRKIGLDPAEVRQRIDPALISKEWVIEGIRARHAKALPLNAGSVAHGDFKDIPLLHHALNLFPGWEAAVRAAGLEPLEIGVHGRSRYESEENVVNEIKRRLANGLRVNHATIRDDDPALASSAYRKFGSWNLALEAAGLTPEQAKPHRPRMLKSGKQILTELPAPGRLLAFVDDGGTPEKPLENLAAHFHVMCGVLIPAENYLEIKRALESVPELLPLGIHEFHATQMVNPGRSAWKKHSVRQRLDTMTLLFKLLRQHANQIVFGFISGEQFDAEMRHRLPAELKSIESKQSLEKVFFNALMPHLKSLSGDVGIVMDSDIETENRLRIQDVADPRGIYQGGVLRVDSCWEIGVQLADLAAYTFNRVFHVRSRAAAGNVGPFDELIVDSMQQLLPLFRNVLELEDRQEA